jgi:hypothetical protein
MSPRFDLTHLAINVLGFSPSVATWDLKAKVWRCILRLAELQVVTVQDKQSLFVKKNRGQYSITLERGGYFARKRFARQATRIDETTVHEPLRSLGFDDGGIRWLVKTFPMPMLREWTDIALAAKEKFGASHFKKSPQAWLVDNLKNAAVGRRTPPDWWHEQRRAENQARPLASSPGRASTRDTPTLDGDSRQAFGQIASDIFSVFLAGGQPEGTAKINAERFAKECVRRGDGSRAAPLQRLFKE